MSKAKSSNPYLRKLTIQIGVCKRMSKESAYYVKEVDENTAKVQKMRDDDRDPFEIKKQEEVLEESIMMVPDSRRRLGEEIDKLVELLDDEAAQETDVTEKVEEARGIIADYGELKDVEVQCK